MNSQLIYTLIYLVGFYCIIQLSEFIYHKFSVNAEVTRKIAHVLCCLSSLSFLFLFHSHWYVLIIGIAFSLLLFMSKRNGMYSSIDLVERKSIGSYLLPISIYLIFLISELANDKLYFVLPLLILGISDPMAGLVGTSYKKARQIKLFSVIFQKTYIGSLTFFILTFVLTVLVINASDFSGQNSLFLGFYFALTLTLVEIVSNKGVDNLTVPLVASLLIWTIQ